MNISNIPIDIVNDAQKLLDDLGKSFEEMRYQAPPQSQPPARHLTFLQRTLGGSSAPKSSSLHQEQQQYERDTRSMPASKFWPLAKSSYPILHEIAQKVHAIQLLAQNGHSADEVEENGGLDALERLQESQSESIYTQAYRIITQFFGDDENDENGQNDENSRASAAGNAQNQWNF
ncbi:Protein CBG18785 [Caenorhabditis briggsae]|uniref:Protein CBG18785 n=1 Tax=Caenorhabditis briggsae TaxID=6238 RepID=A8XU41_CAEBR|nr:Protein CBG18785 [Caenorhabditis briggsae]CAP36166.2 Protein CBG18785 [Caenorhabditis briggsae]